MSWKPRRSIGGRSASKVALIAVVVGAVAAVAAVSTATARPHPTATLGKAAGCPFKGGQIRAFQTMDLTGVAGDIGPSTYRAAQVWIPYINAHGGILGCKLVVDMVDEPFPDVQQCLRHYREAIASNKYDFYFGSFNSACMAVVPTLINKAGKAVIANSAADHEPFFNPKFQKFNFHGAVSTFLEGRGVAVWAKKEGWKRVSTITPNFAYGQDIVKSFVQYFTKIQPGGKIVAQQFPAFGEKNMQPFINAVVAPKPDAVVGGEFSTDILTFWKQWIADGLKIPNLTLSGLPNLEAVKSPSQMPPNSFGFIRGWWSVVDKNPIGAQLFKLYTAKYGHSAHPVPSAWGFAWVSGVQMAKGMIEATKSLDPNAWVKLVEGGHFTFASPYHAGLTSVDPINHMANTCVTVGHLTFNKALPVPGTYDLKNTIQVCMNDILTPTEAKALTTNPRVSAAAAQYAYTH
jgi:branched-chain amino acid transport system substrate-binding protein